MRESLISIIYMFLVLILFLVDYFMNISTFDYHLGDLFLVLLFTIIWVGFSIPRLKNNNTTRKISLYLPPIGSFLVIYILIFYSYENMVGFAIGLLSILVTFATAEMKNKNR